MKRIAYLLAFLFPTFLNSSVLAEENDGNFYLTVGSGYQFPQTTTFKGPVSGTVYKLEYEWNASGIYGFGLGYDFGQWKLHGNYSKGTLHFDSIKLDGSKLAVTIEDIDATSISLSGFYEFTKKSSLTPFIGTGLSYQYGSDALASVKTGGKTTNFTIKADGIWAVNLSAGLAYEIKKNVEIFADTGLAISLTKSDLPAGWSEESPLLTGFGFGLIYSF